MDRHRTRPPNAGSGGWAKSSVSGISVCRFSRVIQSLRAVLISDADSSLISARSEITETRCAGNRPFMPVPNLAWASARRRWPVQQQFLVAGEPDAGDPAKHTLQRQVGRCGPQPGRVGRAVRLDVRHPPVR